MAQNEEIKKILQKINEGTATSAEKERLKDWYSSFDDSQTQVEASFTEEEIGEQIWKKIGPKKSVNALWRKLAVSAAVVALIGITGLVWIRQQAAKPAPLELSMGVQIEGATQKVENIGTALDSFLDSSSYVDVRSAAMETEQMRISTQRGQFAKVILPDGTKVSLNADTKIRLSPGFETAAQRTIELEGEAYFEVTSIPNRSFVVKTKEQEVHVLGTKFNVKAYPNQKHIVTSLIEGSIQLVDQDKTQLLKPNQKAINTVGAATLLVEDQDLQNLQDWRQLNFEFDNEPVDEVLQQLGRWYGLEVLFDSAIPDQTISGKIKRGTNLNDLQLILANLTKAQYQLKANVLHVKFKNN